MAWPLLDFQATPAPGEPNGLAKPADIVASMVQAGAAKAQLGPFDLLVRGCLSGALLGIATSLALGAAVQTGQILVGALIFPVGFVMIVLLGLELVTGSFAVLPMALFARRASPAAIITNWSWVFLGNLIGSVAYAGLFVIARHQCRPDRPRRRRRTHPPGRRTQDARLRAFRRRRHADRRSSRRSCATGWSASAW